MSSESQYYQLNGNGSRVPPSTKVRIAQRAHLLPKTYFSTDEGKKQFKKLIYASKKHHESVIGVQNHMREMAEEFGPQGFQLDQRLGNITTELCNASETVYQLTKAAMEDLEVKCKSVKPVEAEYRGAYKTVTRSEEKLNKAIRSGATESQIRKLDLKHERTVVNCTMVRENYDGMTLGLGLANCVGLLNNLQKTSEAILGSSDEIYQETVGATPNSDLVYQDGGARHVPDMIDFDIPVCSTANNSIGDSSSNYDHSSQRFPSNSGYGPKENARNLGPTEPPSRISKKVEPLRWSTFDSSNQAEEEAHNHSLSDVYHSNGTSPWR